MRKKKGALLLGSFLTKLKIAFMLTLIFVKFADFSAGFNY
jgi:hypothetical protein